MKKKEWIRKSALAALGIVLAAEITMMVREEGKGEARAESVYAQGEYVKTLEGIQSPFADVVDVVMPCVVGVSNRARTYSIISGQTDVIEQATGSGVMINTQGHVVTNYHVIEEAYSADAITSDECAHTVTKVIAWDKELDLAIIQCDISNSQPLTISQREITTGETVYTVGSSLGLTGTISDGIVSAASREVEGVECIQITAPISHGNSGGPLLNRFGEAIGINSMTLNEGQNLNFAINIHLIESLDRSAPKTMEEFYNETAPQAGESDEEGGEWVYSDADESEEEPNDMPVLADSIENSEWIAGYCDEEDIDFFSFTLTEDTTVTTCLISYYEIDSYLMISGIVDGDLNVLASMDLQEDDDGELLTTTIDLPAGTYYVVVGLDEDYPFDTGAYYELSVLW